MARITKIISVSDVEKIAYKMALELKWKESIPSFDTRFKGKLEGALAAPFQNPHYASVMSKGAALFYFMIKDHPFQNGNKRIALTTLFVYLFRNGYWIKMSPDKLYKLARWIAESPGIAHDKEINMLGDILGEFKIKLRVKK